ncbi:glycerol-3-phosphate acyltransferase 2, mitochondrial-like [Acipenser ruthenus]|uniref:glycerol-3-phosphate acyltransferase 2, mitochondrial-like n=1 Tax=Acipenser ruthenus TaxID=7906 RepID=UPI002741073E|nr:glycerol-3-phosphate acyltransferase 2, mitochondrial-like [Acipenser ruthenus]
MLLDRGDATLGNPPPAPPIRSRTGVSWSLKIKKKLKGVTPFLGKFRPTVGQCCHQCTPESLGMKLLKNSPSLGFQNVLHVNETRTRFRGWLVRRVCGLLFVQERKVYPSPAGDRAERVLRSSRVQSLISSGGPTGGAVAGEGSSHIGETAIAATARRGQAVQILEGIQTSISPPLLRLAGWILLKLLGRMFANVQVSLNQLATLHKAPQLHGAPLVFVSVHKSSLDYALVPLVLFCHSLRVPYMVSSTDLEHTWLRPILQKVGVIFAPRCPMGKEDTETGTLQCAVLSSFVSELLSEGQHLLLFLEEPGCVERRPSPCSTQWLSWVREAVCSGAVPDVALVPVGIAYDAPVEGLGDSCQQAPRCGGFLSLLLSALSLLGRSHGCVRLDFGQPFSLKEMISSGRLPVRGLPLEDILLPAVMGSRSDSLFADKSLGWVLPVAACPQLEEQERHLVASLCKHLLYSATSCSAVMSTSMLSCLLLHRHRKQGVAVPQLARDFSWLLEEVLFRNRDVGFGGSLPEVLCHSMTLLRDSLVLCTSPSAPAPLVAPRSTPQAAMTLSRHCGALQHLFIHEAVGACAVSAMLSEMMDCVNIDEMDFDVALCQEELTERVAQLCQLLPSEALLLPPCQSVYSFAQDSIDSLVRCGILVMEELPRERPLCDLWGRRQALLWKSFDDLSNSDSDCEEPPDRRSYKLNQPNHCPDFFFFLCSVLSPLLRALSWSVCGLQHLYSPLTESECIERMQGFLLDKTQGESSYFESATLEMAATAVWTLRDLGVLKEEPGEGGAVCLRLSEAFEQPLAQGKLCRFIERFLYH